MGVRRPADCRHVSPARLLAVSLAAGALLAACGGGDSPGTPGRGAGAALPAPPLDTSAATVAGSWAILAMGRLDQADNTFWEVFSLANGTRRWALVTPAGVADNGGLVGTPSGKASFVVAFGTSQLLGFSPVASSADAGTSWQAGVLPSGVTPLPDALASSLSGGFLALVGDPADGIDSSGGGLSSWHTLSSETAVAASPAGLACGVSAITAVAFAPAGTALLGAGCLREGHVGIIASSGGGWRLVGPALPAALSGTGNATSVIGLGTSSTGVSALVAVQGTGGVRLLVASSRTGTGGWSLSPALDLGSSVTLLSTGMLAGGRRFVLLGDGSQRRVEVLDEGDRRWQALAGAPPTTATIASGPGGSIDAMAVTGSTLTIYRLSGGARSWARTQVTEVPIVYGSSS